MIVSRLRDLLRRVPPTNNLFRKTKIYAIWSFLGISSPQDGQPGDNDGARESKPSGPSRAEGGAGAAEFFI
jgi:hypothetical protein